jgi:hypothetical protein
MAETSLTPTQPSAPVVQRSPFAYTDPYGDVWESFRVYKERAVELAVARGCTIPYPPDLSPSSWATGITPWEGGANDGVQGWERCQCASYGDGSYFVSQSVSWDGQRFTYDNPTILSEVTQIEYTIATAQTLIDGLREALHALQLAHRDYWMHPMPSR